MWYCFTKSVSIMAVLISLVFSVVNFFSVFAGSERWYYSVPMMLGSSLYTLVLNYESMVLNNALEYPTMFADWSAKLWLSTLGSLGYSLNLYSTFYYKMKLQETRRKALSSAQKH